MILTPEQRALVDGARERANSATEGLWISLDGHEHRDAEGWPLPCIKVGDRVLLEFNPHFPSNADGKFIANARQDQPALCDLVDELEERLGERADAARAWDALAVTRLQTITEYSARIVQLEERLKKETTEREAEVSQYEADIERALGPDALGARRYESGFAPDYIIRLHNHYTNRMRVSEEARIKAEHERDTYKRIASIKKSSAKDP